MFKRCYCHTKYSDIFVGLENISYQCSQFKQIKDNNAYMKIINTCLTSVDEIARKSKNFNYFVCLIMLQI